MIKLVILDVGDTLIEQVDDVATSLDRLRVVPLEGALNAVRRLGVRFRVTLLSNTHRTTNKQLRALVRRLGVGDVIPRVFTSVSIGASKPNAAAFKAVLSTFGVAPQETVMVGNSLEEDINGAAALGIRTVWVKEGQAPPTPSAHLVVDRVANLTPDAIEQLGRLPARIPARERGDDSDAQLRLDVRPARRPAVHRTSGIDVSDVVDLERTQEWRRIGIAWFEYARGIKPELSAEAEQWLQRAKPDGATHHFPTVLPSDASWSTMSHLERAGRAFRYAGYHFEEDGDQQTTFLLYYRSAECFWEAERSAEAARSYYLALMSFVRRYGQLDDEILSKLRRAYDSAIARDEDRYLPPIVVQYRRIGAALRVSGNFRHYMRLRKLRLDTEREALRKDRHWFRYLLRSAWRFSSMYGQSLVGWCGLFALANGLLFPIAYAFPGVAAPQLRLGQAFLLSLGRMIAYSPFDAGLTTLGSLIAIGQGLATLVWVGVLASIIVTRNQE